MINCGSVVDRDCDASARCRAVTRAQRAWWTLLHVPHIRPLVLRVRSTSTILISQNVLIKWFL